MTADCLNWAFYFYVGWSVLKVLQWWGHFSCAEPVQVWLLCHLIIVFLLRLMHQIAHKIGPSNAYAQHENMFLPVHGSRRQRILSFFILIVMVPAFVASDILGVMWFSVYARKSCWPYEPLLNPELVGLMLFFCCFWGFVYILFILGMVCNRCRGRRRNLWGPPRAVGNDVAMSTLLLDCPEAECAKECTAYCSICQDNCREGQKLRTIAACGHQYHSECLERWLTYRPLCPLCMRNVSDPIEV